jgi:hypothetical protein
MLLGICPLTRKSGSHACGHVTFVHIFLGAYIHLCLLVVLSSHVSNVTFKRRTIEKHAKYDDEELACDVEATYDRARLSQSTGTTYELSRH